MRGRRSIVVACCASLARAHSISTPARAHTLSTPFSKHGIALVRDFLPADEFATVVEDVRKLRSSLKPEKNSMAVGRYGRMLDNRSDAHSCLASDATTKRINRIAGFPSPPLITSEYPMELRVYRVGAGMDWHVDDCLFEPLPQCEVVLVLENTSDSFTEFIDADGVLHSEWTPPNSALLVRAGGAKHRVQPLKRGERTIVKLVYKAEGSSPVAEGWNHLDSLPGLRAKQRPGRKERHSTRRR